MRLLSSILVVLSMILVSPVAARDLLVRSIDRIDQFNEPQKKCESDKSSCSSFIQQWTEDDSKDGLLGSLPSRKPICEKSLEAQKSKITNASELHDVLGKLRRYPEEMKGRVDLLIQCAGNDAQARDLVSKYHFVTDKISSAESAVLNDLAAIDQMLGKSPLADIDCSLEPNIELSLSCEELKKSCEGMPKQSPLSKMSRKIEQSEKELLQLERVLKENQDPKAQEFAAVMIQGHLEKYPWLAGSEFRKARNEGKNIETATKAQMKFNSKELLEVRSRVHKLGNCVFNEGLKDCSPEEMNKILMEAPGGSFAALSGDKKSLAAKSYLDVQSCVFDGSLDRDQTGKIIGHAAISAGLSGVTLGAGALLNAGKLGYSFMMGRIAINAASATNILANSSFLAMSLKDANRSCNEEKVKIDKLIAKQNIEKMTCPQPDQAVSQAQEDYESCRNAYLFAALDAFPFVPDGVTKHLRKAVSLRKASPPVLFSKYDESIAIIKSLPPAAQQAEVRRIKQSISKERDDAFAFTKENGAEHPQSIRMHKEAIENSNQFVASYEKVLREKGFKTHIESRYDNDIAVDRIVIDSGPPGTPLGRALAGLETLKKRYDKIGGTIVRDGFKIEVNPTDLSTTTDGHFRPAVNAINLSPEVLLAENLPSVLTHELRHASDWIKVLEGRENTGMVQFIPPVKNAELGEGYGAGYFAGEVRAYKLDANRYDREPINFQDSLSRDSMKKFAERNVQNGKEAVEALRASKGNPQAIKYEKTGKTSDESTLLKVSFITESGMKVSMPLVQKPNESLVSVRRRAVEQIIELIKLNQKVLNSR